ncbi:MAG TPA: hypothetical protein VG796_04485 [Verrucomicrobiales bacterium]|jgi:hypothetical protein|nr:hypothetical protein [Verrucomicrobiales bacterium]
MMTRAFPLLVSFAAALFLSCARGEEITLRDGKVEIQVPVPEGFERVPESSPQFKEMQSNVSRGGNDLLLLLAQKPNAGKEEGFTRLMNVQFVRANRGRQATKAYLDSERLTMEESAKKALQKVKADMNVAEMVMDPVYDFSERHFSAVVRLPAGNDQTVYSIVTPTLVRGRIWFLNVVATGKDEEQAWAKSAAKKWLGSILQASPSDKETLELEEGKGRGLFDGIGNGAIYGAIGGGIGALIAVLLKKRRNAAKTE